MCSSFRIVLSVTDCFNCFVRILFGLLMCAVFGVAAYLWWCCYICLSSSFGMGLACRFVVAGIIFLHDYSVVGLCLSQLWLGHLF